MTMTLEQQLKYLEKLDKDDKKQIILNHNNKEIANRLINDNSWEVRLFLAKSIKTPKNLLETLSNDENNQIRSEVSRNQNTSKKVLLKLTKDQDYFVKTFALENMRKI